MAVHFSFIYLLSLWNHGVHLIVICALAFVLCFIPLFLPDMNRKLYDDDQTTSPESSTLHSTMSYSFRYALIASVAVSCPMALEFFIDVASYYSKSWTSVYDMRQFWQLAFPRLVLIISLFAPDLLNLLIAIPLKFSELSLCFFASRYILLYYGIWGQLWVVDRILFNSFIFSISYTLLALSILFFTWDCIHLGPKGISYILYLTFGTTGSALFIYQLILWSKKIARVHLNDLSTEHVLCASYIILFSILCFAILVLYIVFYGNFNTIFLCTVTYLTTGFTLLLITSNSMVTRYQYVLIKNTLVTKRDFVRFASHEIRTPLNTVWMGLELLERESKFLQSLTQQQEFHDIITDLKNACSISLDILNDLLSYEKLEAGIMQLELRVVDAASFLIDSVRPFLIQARKLSVELELPLEGSSEFTSLKSTFIEIDTNRMSQVIRNLVSNALKFSHRNGKVTISTELINDAIVAKDGTKSAWQKLLRIQVIDTGCGIAKENLTKLFNEVIQIDAGKLQKGGGSGFGLYLSKSIIDLHKGRVSVHSEGEGKGSTFILDIPVTDKRPEYLVPSTSRNEYEDEFHVIPLTTHAIHERRGPQATDFASFSFRTKSSFVDVSNHSLDISQLSQRSSNSVISFFSNNSSHSSQSGKFSRIACGTAADPLVVQCLNSSEHTADKLEKLERNSNSGNKTPISKSNLSISKKITPARTYDPNIGVTEKKGLQLRVLIVDDSGSNRKILSRLLKDKFTIMEASDGAEAVSMVLESLEQKAAIDVVLMDCEMPNMRGPEAAHTLRTAGFAGLIVGLTGHAGEADIQDFISSGADKVLPKPVDVDVLEEIINGLCNIHEDVDGDFGDYSPDDMTTCNDVLPPV